MTHSMRVQLKMQMDRIVKQNKYEKETNEDAIF